MLDFDDKEFYEGFENEFKKGKRKRRNDGQFPGWVAIVLIIVAGVSFFFYKNQNQPKTDLAGTETVQSSTVTTGVTENAQSQATLPVENIADTSGPGINPSDSTAVLPSEISPDLSSQLEQETETSEPKLTETVQSEDAKQVTQMTVPTQGLNFFQRIGNFFKSEDSEPSTETPESAQLSTQENNSLASENPFAVTETIRPQVESSVVLSEETAAALTLSDNFPEVTEVQSVSTAALIGISTAETLPEGSTPESSTMVTPVVLPAETRVADVTSTSGSAKLPEEVGATIIAPVIVSHATKSATLSLQTGLPDQNIPAETDSVITPDSTGQAVIEITEEISTLTPLPEIPTATPTSQPNIFQRFVTFIFPNSEEPTATAIPTSIPLTETPIVLESDPTLELLTENTGSAEMVPTALPDATEQTPIQPEEESPVPTNLLPDITPEPTAQPNIVQRFFTFIFPQNDPTATITPTATVIIPTSTASMPPVSLIVASTQEESKAVRATPTAFVPQKDVSSTETPAPSIATESSQKSVENVIVKKDPATSEPTVSDLDDEPLKFEEESPEPTIVLPEGTIVPTKIGALDLNPRLTMFADTPTSDATETIGIAGQDAGTKVPVYHPTELPDTGFADQWNIPMMILVIMILLAMILGVRLLRNKQ